MIKKFGLFLVLFCTIGYAKAEMLVDDIPDEYFEYYESEMADYEEAAPALTTETQSEKVVKPTTSRAATAQTSRAAVSGTANQRAITSRTSSQATGRNTRNTEISPRATTSRTEITRTSVPSTGAATNRSSVSRVGTPSLSRSATISRSAVNTTNSAARSATRTNTTASTRSATSSSKSATRTKLLPTGYSVSSSTASSYSDGSDSSSVDKLNALKAKSALVSSGLITTGTGSTSVSKSKAATTSSLATKTIASIDSDKTDFNSCKNSYFDCMGEFCNVLNKSAKSCSCSTRMKGFKTKEDNLSQATVDLYNVLQNITYVGYSTEEVKAMFKASEGELAIGEDTTENKQILEDINALLSGNAVSNTSLFSSSNDMMSEITAIANSYSSIDGTSSEDVSTDPSELFATAEESCKSILDTCGENSVDTNSIKKLYNLGITTDCDTYEKTITNQVNSMKKNLLAADTTLKKARLQAQKDKNKYDFSQCVNALSECMTTDAICGDDYESCLDMYGKVISSEGELIETANVSSLVSADSEEFREWLTKKIGTAKKEGVCRGVMDLCQKYTYKNDKYNDKNDVLASYLDSVTNLIKAKQTELTASYKSSCMTDLANCYRTNAKSIAVFDSSVSYDYVRSVVDATCYDIALSCAKSVYGENSNLCPEKDDNKCVENISSVLLNSLSKTYSCGDGKGYYDGKCQKCENIPSETEEKYLYYNSITGECMEKTYTNCASLVAKCVEEDNYCQQLASAGYDTNKVAECFSRCEYKDECGGRPSGLCKNVIIGYVVGNPNLSPKRFASPEFNYPIIKEIVSLIDKYTKEIASSDAYFSCTNTNIQWDCVGNGDYSCKYNNTWPLSSNSDCPGYQITDSNTSACPVDDTTSSCEAREPIRLNSSSLSVCAILQLN